MVAAAVQMAGVHAQTETIESFNPPAFNDNRVTTDLLFMYTFDQDECESGAFADKRNDTTSLLGDLTYNTATANPGWTTVTKCPSVVIGSATFENAYRGTTSQGQRYDGATASLERDDSARSENDISGLLGALSGVTDFSLEFWIRPDFTSGGNNHNYVLLEIDGDRPTSPIDFPWECTSGDFDLQVYYDNTNNDESFKVVYKDGTNDCSTVDLGQVELTAGTLYHVVITSVQGTFQTFQIAVDNGTPSGPPPENTINFGLWDSNNHARIGSSIFALSTLNDASAGGFYSWSGDVLFFAMYSDDLTSGVSGQIGDNFAAGLPNSESRSVTMMRSTWMRRTGESFPSEML